MLILRSILNSIFFGLWTAFMVTVAVTLGALRRDPTLFKRMQRDWARGLIKFWGVEVRVHGAREHGPVAQLRGDVQPPQLRGHRRAVSRAAEHPRLPRQARADARPVPRRRRCAAAATWSIDRGQRTNAMQAINLAAEQVRGGKTVLIFPEGTRGDSDTIGDFKKGGFYLATAASRADPAGRAARHAASLSAGAACS